MKPRDAPGSEPVTKSLWYGPAIAYLMNRYGATSGDRSDPDRNLGTETENTALYSKMAMQECSRHNGNPTQPRKTRGRQLKKTLVPLFVEGRSALSTEQAVSDHDCAFGNCCFGPGLERFGNRHEMVEVREPHAEMRSLIRKIIELKHQDKTEETEELCQKVGPLSEKIVHLIEGIRQKLLA